MTDINIKSIHCGRNHSMIYKKNGELWGFGNNRCGQLGLNSNNINVPTLILIDTRIEQISCGDNHTLIYKSNKELWGCGSNNYGQLPYLKQYNKYNKLILLCKFIVDIQYIHAGTSNSFIYEKNGRLSGCGMNDHGNLGIGNSNIQHKPVLIMSDPTIIQWKNDKIIREWNLENHKYFLEDFKNKIFNFLLCNKTIDKYYRIPKFVLYEIFKFTV